MRKISSHFGPAVGLKRSRTAFVFLYWIVQLTFAALIDHYERPRNVGSMSKADADVGTGLVGAPACGDVMKLQIRVDPDTQRIADVKFKTFGCGSAIASSSYLTELVQGMTLEEAGRIRNTEIAKELCLPPVKRKSAMSNLPQFDTDFRFQFIALCLLKMPSNRLFLITTPKILLNDRQPTWLELM